MILLQFTLVKRERHKRKQAKRNEQQLPTTQFDLERLSKLRNNLLLAASGLNTINNQLQ